MGTYGNQFRLVDVEDRSLYVFYDHHWRTSKEEDMGMKHLQETQIDWLID